MNVDLQKRRTQALQSLVRFNQPLEHVLRRLQEFGFDSDEELVVLSPEHIIEVMERFAAGELSSAEVEQWANALEGREDIGLGAVGRSVLKKVLFELANPALEGALSVTSAEQMVERLRFAIANRDKAAEGES